MQLAKVEYIDRSADRLNSQLVTLLVFYKKKTKKEKFTYLSV